MAKGPHEIKSIMALIDHKMGFLYKELEDFNISRSLARYIFRYTVCHSIDIVENNNKKELPWSQMIFKNFNLPRSKLEEVMLTIMCFTLKHCTPALSELSTPCWLQWQVIEDIKTTGPSAAILTPNRLDIFARGNDGSLWHKYCVNGAWGSWEGLGGKIISSPSAVLPTANRINVFARGEDNTLWHIYCNNHSWSKWESLGGVLTSSPSAVATQTNNIDVFARGRNNHLWQIRWDGVKWSNWENLNVIVTSAPIAMSTDNNKIQVVARDKDYSQKCIVWNGSI